MMWLCGCLIALLALQQFLHHQSEAKWMRMFAERQGIPLNILDNKPKEELKAVPAPDMRKRISVPIPGASHLRQK